MKLRDWLLSLIDTRAIGDPEIKQDSETLQAAIIPFLFTAVAFTLVAVVALPIGWKVAPLSGGAAVFMALGMWAARRGFVRTAASGVISALFAVATIDLYLGGGVDAPAQGVYLIAILMSAFVISLRAAVVTTAFSIVTTGIIAWLDATDRLPQPIIDREPSSYWLAQVITFIAASGLIWLALQRIQLALARARNSERLQSVVGNLTNEFIWQMSPDGRFTYASAAVEKILGWSPQEMLERRATQDQLVGDPPDVGALIAEALGDGRTTIRYEAQQLHRDGTPVWCEFTAHLHTDEQGDLIGLSGATRDIGIRKQEERKREELELQLRQSQRMEAIGKLAGGIAHDFNNYLTVILGNAELLALDTNAEKGSPVVEIEDAATRSAELTRQLLAFSRKQVLQPVVMDLNRVIREADRLLRRVIGEDISLETICAGGLWNVSVDPAQFEQVLLNLVINAREAMPEGGKLTIETGNVYLDSEYAERRIELDPGRYVMLAVSDTGTGMDDETRSHVFEPFFTTRPKTGSGLGLSTVHGIVTQSGGTIGVYSEPGEGTTFRVYLPRAEHETAERSDPIELVGEGGDLSGLHVLVVEDQEMVRRLIRKMLEAQGCRVYTASDGEQALAIAESEDGEIDLLLTDIVLPGASGVQIARELTDRWDLRVLYMSGFTENGIVHRGILDPEHLLLQKPFTTKQLVQKIREAIED